MSSFFSFRCWLWASVYSLIFLLLIVWQMPGTIGFRYVLMGLLLPTALALNGWRSPYAKSHRVDWSPLLWLALLSVWMMMVISLWGQNPKISWGEFRGQWLSALAAGLVGLMLSRAAIRDSASQVRKLLMTIFWALVIQVLIHNGLDVLYWFSTDNLPFRQAPVLYLPNIISALIKGEPWQEAFTGDSPDKFSYVNNVFAALLAAEAAQRVMLKKRWLTCSDSVLIISFGAMLLCSYWLQTRNGNVGLLLLLTLVGLMMAFRLIDHFGITRVISGGLLVLVAISTLGNMMIRSDPRWQKLAETIPIALDTQTNRTWLTMDGKYPKLTNGEQVDASAYERLAWAKEGAQLVFDNPWGTGYNRLAYGAGIDHKYQMNGAYRAHSHSGVIDFTIANGVVGLILWLGFLGSLFYVGWQTFRNGQIGLGLTLMFLVSGFMVRSIVDSNIRDHVLQQFIFLAMILHGLTANKKQVQLLP